MRKLVKNHSGEPVVLEDATFYVALFEDEGRKERAGKVQELHLEQTSEASVVFCGLTPGVYYFAETDESGAPVAAVEYGNGVYVPDYTEGQMAAVEEGECARIAFENIVTELPVNPYLPVEPETESEMEAESEENTKQMPEEESEESIKQMSEESEECTKQMSEEQTEMKAENSARKAPARKEEKRDNVPSGEPERTAAKTGDNTPVEQLLTLLALSVLAIFLICVKRRKERR